MIDIEFKYVGEMMQVRVNLDGGLLYSEVLTLNQLKELRTSLISGLYDVNSIINDIELTKEREAK